MITGVGLLSRIFTRFGIGSWAYCIGSWFLCLEHSGLGFWDSVLQHPVFVLLFPGLFPWFKVGIYIYIYFNQKQGIY